MGFAEQHLQELPDPQAEMERAFGFIVEKRHQQKYDELYSCTSYVQRKLQCGYNRAAVLMEEMEKQFWVTAPDGRGARKIIRQGV